MIGDLGFQFGNLLLIFPLNVDLTKVTNGCISKDERTIHHSTTIINIKVPTYLFSVTSSLAFNFGFPMVTVVLYLLSWNVTYSANVRKCSSRMVSEM